MQELVTSSGADDFLASIFLLISYLGADDFSQDLALIFDFASAFSNLPPSVFLPSLEVKLIGYKERGVTILLQLSSIDMVMGYTIIKTEIFFPFTANFQAYSRETIGALTRRRTCNSAAPYLGPRAPEPSSLSHYKWGVFWEMGIIPLPKPLPRHYPLYSPNTPHLPIK